jgi:hypothetical protein
MNATTPITWTQPGNSIPGAGPATENSNAHSNSCPKKRYRNWKNGMMEYWKTGKTQPFFFSHLSNIPIFQCSGIVMVGLARVDKPLQKC